MPHKQKTMDDVLLPHGLNISSMWIEHFMVDEIFCPYEWKIFPYGKWKKGRKQKGVLDISKCGTNERNQRVFHLGDIVKLLVHTTLVEK
jgi:hypothetical protein